MDWLHGHEKNFNNSESTHETVCHGGEALGLGGVGRWVGWWDKGEGEGEGKEEGGRELVSYKDAHRQTEQQRDRQTVPHARTHTINE